MIDASVALALLSRRQQFMLRFRGPGRIYLEPGSCRQRPRAYSAMLGLLIGRSIAAKLPCKSKKAKKFQWKWDVTHTCSFKQSIGKIFSS